jgi:hypothetical protein
MAAMARKTAKARRQTEKAKSFVLDEMAAMLRLDPGQTPFDRVAESVQQLDEGNRSHLLELCEAAFGDARLRAHEPTRRAAATAVVALVPASAETIRRWVDARSGKGIYEVHFSIFCFLDWVPRLAYGAEFASEVLSLVEAYLLEVRSEAAQAAWMAGDLLGDHWEEKQALPVLIRAAREARYVAGRKGAVHGLYHIALAPESDSACKSSMSVLRHASRNDRSVGVRSMAAFYLRDLKRSAGSTT